MRYLVEVIVKPKSEVKDTGALAADKTLRRLKIEENANFCCGKFFSFNLSANDTESLKSKLDFICREVISNPVIETFQILNFSEVKE